MAIHIQLYTILTHSFAIKQFSIIKSQIIYT